MSGRPRVQKVMVQPIRTRVQVWLFEQTNLRLEGYILGFDEYMNIVLDDAEEVYTKKPGAPSRRRIGQILLKGDNITLMQMARPA